MVAYDCKNEEVFNLGTSVRKAMIIGNISELYLISQWYLDGAYSEDPHMLLGY